MIIIKKKQKKNRGCKKASCVMTHTPPQPATASTAVAIGLAKDSELLASLLQLLWLSACCLSSSFSFFLLFFFFFGLPMFCTCVCFGLSASLCGGSCQGTRGLTTPLGRRKRGVVVCENSGSHSNTHLY